MTYTWAQTAGASAVIINPGQQTISVLLPLIPTTEILVFRLTVTDPLGAFATDTVSVTVNDVAVPNNAPVADAGSDASGNEGDQLTLSAAASSDDDGDTLSYSWQQTSGPQATITGDDQVTASLLLPEVDSTATLVIQLTATDPSGASSSDTVIITVNDIVPTITTPPPAEETGGGAINPLWLMMALILRRPRRFNVRLFP